MRQTVYKCDRCKKDIKKSSYVLRWYNTKPDRDDGIFVINDFNEMDLCEQCMARVRNAIRRAMVPDETDTKRVLDDGKIGALREAGWSLKAIAEEMGCSIPTVHNHLKAMGKEEQCISAQKRTVR